MWQVLRPGGHSTDLGKGRRDSVERPRHFLVRYNAGIGSGVEPFTQ